MMDAVTEVSKELKIPIAYIKRTSRKDRVVVVVQRLWLNTLVKTQSVPVFAPHESLSPEEVQAWMNQGEDLGASWSKVLIKVWVKGQKKVIPLPRARPVPSKCEPDLSFAQVLHYVSQTNHKNLWKEAFKKYLSGWMATEEKPGPAVGLVSCAAAMREVIRRVYGCPLVGPGRAAAGEGRHEAPCNVLAAVCAVETPRSFLLVHPWVAEHTAQDCVTFSPALLASANTRPLFLMYQLLQAMRDLHDRGTILGDITLGDVLLRGDLWIQIMPHLEDNIHDEPRPECRERRADSCDGECPDEAGRGRKPRCDSDGAGCELKRLSELWVRGQLSNLEYLRALNQRAGRRHGDPTGHHVVPWVSDFTSRSGLHWRDLSRSKYRLNKGDRQLDFTYDAPSNGTQVPHHVSDVLSEITYYVYLARRTPRSVLCKYVRSRWVPAEYPSSIQRLQAWTPDECIPEFFCDPTVFQSIHADMPDLDIPPWAQSIQDFVDWHREALESPHVSERLHHWIDLTFGYKLSGAAAVKAKNVCLQLVDSHTSLASTGVVQLFAHPHPQRVMPSPFWGKTPPRLQLPPHQSRRVGERMSEEEGHSSGFEEDEVAGAFSQNHSCSSPLTLSRFLSRSRGSLQALAQPGQAGDETGPRPPEPPRQSASGASSQTIFLPRDFNPTAAIQQVELQHSFLMRTFHQGPEVDWIAGGARGGAAVGLMQVVACRRIREMQVLGCLIVELFLSSKLRALDSHNSGCFDQRLEACRSVLRWSGDGLPPCARHVVSLLLRTGEGRPPGPFRYPPVTRQGLPPPSAHQLLQPVLFAAVLPFPRCFPRLLRLPEALRDEPAECRVKSAARELAVLLPQLSGEGLGLLLPYVVQLLEDPATCVPAAWCLFDPVAAALGPGGTAQHLLPSVLALYDYRDDAGAVKLYHHSFLLQLVVRLGLRVFLGSFVTPLVEAVGGYRDLGHAEGSSQHQRTDMRARAAHLKVCDTEENIGEVDVDQVLSPVEDDYSEESDHRNMHQEEKLDKDTSEQSPHCDTESKDSEPGMCVPEGEDGKASPAEEGEARLYAIMAQLDLATPRAGSEGDGEGEDAVFNTCQDETSSNTADDAGEQSDEMVQEQLTEEVDPIEQFLQETGHKEDRFQRENSQCKVSDMSADSVAWLSHRLGPVLTARHLSRNLLRMLALCYLGSDNLQPAHGWLEVQALSITSTTLVGDRSAAKVVESLSAIATLYGEQFVLLQYLPHMSELIGLCKKKLTVALEGGLVGALSLLIRIVPYLGDTALMDYLQEVLLRNILQPALRLVSSTRLVFPSGQAGRAAAAAKWVDALYVIAQRIGQEMTKKHLAAPALHRFFLAFDKAHDRSREAAVGTSEAVNDSLCSSSVDSSYLEICRDGSSTEWAVRGSAVQETFRENDFGDSFSQPSSDQEWKSCDPTRSKAVEELKAVFTPRLAHLSYLPFVMFLGDAVMEQSLGNADFISELCFDYEKVMQGEQPSTRSLEVFYLSDYLSLGGPQGDEKSDTGNLGSNVSMVGNRIDLQRSDIPSVQLQPASSRPTSASAPGDVMSLISRKMENTKRHLRGNWLAYWEHEIGRAEKDTRFNFKQIKLQTFSGHANSVRALHVLDNENSFISGSRDKTVKLWSLRSQGDGSAVSHCQWTYAGHRRAVVGLAWLESVRLVASCDYGVHLWDPFLGSAVGVLESLQVNVLRAMPAPSTAFLAATTDAVALRLVDARTCSFVSELRVSVNPAGYIRCVTVGPSGSWVAVGQSTGSLTILDVRTGMVVASWKGHEGEVLQLVSAGDTRIISSSLDQTVSVWSALDGKHLYHMKGPTEPVHCLGTYGSELISGTTANRIGVHTAVDEAASFSSTRLRSDTFRGVLTTMAVLPLNRLLLLGADSGNISLLC
ncbi:WD repeat-containing protein 81 [Bacillus rossius redtenbacheri]|uniref:WD repeat-containing protein 81 n=1 Tax=Bacillus rossius redtenbacheri TaxID=93214 RepID=UPI002FDD9AC0